MRIPLIAGNWKMHKTVSEAVEFVSEFRKLYKDTDIRACICAPFVQLPALSEMLKDTDIKLGAQNLHFAEKGAFTGEISADMLREIGVDYCIIGHSERREYFAETDESVNLKLKRCFEAEITPILCVGENESERDAGKAFEKVGLQLSLDLSGIPSEDVSSMVIAYEPIWAIGTGKNATPEQAEEMCGFIRGVIEGLYDEFVADEIIIQYGGSVKPDNAEEILNMPNIDGALVGGASLEPANFMKIIDF